MNSSVRPPDLLTSALVVGLRQAGFLARARASSLRFEEGFLQAVTWHLRKMEAFENDRPLLTSQKVSNLDASELRVGASRFPAYRRLKIQEGPSIEATDSRHFR